MKFTLHLIAAVSAVYRGEPEVYIAHVRGKVRTTLSKTNKQFILHYLYEIISSIAQDFWGQEVFQYIKPFFLELGSNQYSVVERRNGINLVKKHFFNKDSWVCGLVPANSRRKLRVINALWEGPSTSITRPIFKNFKSAWIC